MVLRGLVSLAIIEAEPRWENEPLPQETDELQKPTYPTKMFFFRLRPSPSSLIGRTKFHYGIIALSESLLSVLPLCRDEVRLSQSLAIAVVSACIREFARSTKATNCLLFYPNIIFRPLNKT